MKRIGVHRITNLSVENSGVEELFADGSKAHITYVDPPWGEGNMKYWTTLMAKQCGVKPAALPFATLLQRIISLAVANTKNMVFIENGVKWESQVAEAMQAGGLHSVRITRIDYSEGPMSFISAAVPGASDSGYVPPRLRGVKLPTHCIAAHALAGGVVFDPCCGMGYTAKAAVSAGMRFFGNELNPSRLEKTIEFLERKA